MYSQQPNGRQHAHHFRYYIVLGTLIVGGIFLVLLFNERGLSLTSAIVGADGELTKDGRLNLFRGSGNSTGEKSVDVITAGSQVGDVATILTFNQVPVVEVVDAKIEGVSLLFGDFATGISINEDRLEMNNLKEVDLNIKDFQGKLYFEDGVISLAGVAKKIEVNGVSLASQKEMNIAFDGLQYQEMHLVNVGLFNLAFPRGNGLLSISDRLEYELVEDEVFIKQFSGNVDVPVREGSRIALDGFIKGLSVKGDIIIFEVQ